MTGLIKKYISYYLKGGTHDWEIIGEAKLVIEYSYTNLVHTHPSNRWMGVLVLAWIQPRANDWIQAEKNNSIKHQDQQVLIIIVSSWNLHLKPLLKLFNVFVLKDKLLIRGTAWYSFSSVKARDINILILNQSISLCLS